jgi:DNA topoisomerase-3
MQKLLASGRTDLLARFISKKGRPFKAFLVKTPGGRIGFEFQPRAAKPGAAPKPQAPAAEVKPLKKEKAAPAVKAAKPAKAAKPPARKRRAA